MANVGSLARIALPEILKTIALAEKSGSLEVTSDLMHKSQADESA